MIYARIPKPRMSWPTSSWFRLLGWTCAVIGADRCVVLASRPQPKTTDVTTPSRFSLPRSRTCTATRNFRRLTNNRVLSSCPNLDPVGVNLDGHQPGIERIFNLVHNVFHARGFSYGDDSSPTSRIFPVITIHRLEASMLAMSIIVVFSVSLGSLIGWLEKRHPGRIRRNLIA